MEINFYGSASLFIEQKRYHIPASAGFVRRKFLDLRYAEGSDKRFLDLYLPNDGDGPFPLLVDVFGGGWYFGQRSSYKLDMALELLKRGYAVASIDYSLSHEATFPTQIYELKAAIRFLRNHAAEYGLDPARITVMGESAGAHIATVAAFSVGASMFEDIPFGEAGDATVQAVCAIYCPTDLTLTKAQFEVLGVTDLWIPESGEANSPEGILYGGAVADKADYIRETSVFRMITPLSPPVIFFHGTCDRAVPILQSQTFAAELIRQNGSDAVEYHAVPGAEHNQRHFMTEEIYEQIDRFFKRRLYEKEPHA
ncbi:MAG: alpha/beta hydrolase [Clostridia bacterium]|nr:alpha/beta hydrolase [Clostridia bacterium]